MKQIGTFGASAYSVDQLHLFRDADHGQLAGALSGCAVIRVEAGQLIADSTRARLYIVLCGELAVACDSDHAPPGGTSSKILPGESIGEQAVLDDAANLSAIRATVPSELLVIEAELLWHLIEQSNGLARNLLRLLSFRIRAANALLRRRQKLGEFYRQLSMNDGLTGLYNRAWLNDMLPKLVAAAQRSTSALSLLMIDLDHFKRFNDTHGHLCGDDALRTAAGLISGALRPSDFAVRYGGEEMMVILPETSLPLAMLVAERLCARLRDARVLTDMRIALPHVTGSVGVAVLAEGMNDEALISAADAALYRAKHCGRDRVSV